MFQFPGFAHLIGVTGLQPAGLPHSDTCGSIHACRSPHLFAACRVLPRRRKPRHPPSAICSFFCESMTFVFACEIVLLRPISLLRLSSLPVKLFYLDQSLCFVFFTSFVYLSILSMICHPEGFSYRFFSNGLQRYGLFHYLQIFLQYFFTFFRKIFSHFY